MDNFKSKELETVDNDSQTPESLNSTVDAVIESKDQLIQYLEAGCKSSEFFRLGAEQEQFIFRTRDLSPADYDGPDPGIKCLLEGLMQFGWNPVYENDLPIALHRDGCSITLEPGGQVELSGAPLENVHQVFAETESYHSELALLKDELGLSFLAMGHQPKHSRAEIPWMPKQRYQIMRDWMPKRGSRGLDMMQSTCGIQVNVDFASEADMIKKFRVALALQPVATALFANSPFHLGRPDGYLSERSRIWDDTDPDRCGALPFVFEDGMGFERYTDYALDVPMYFVVRNDNYVDASGLSFRDFLAGRLSILPGQLPLLTDWANHLSTIFPHVRLKQFLEMRGADAGDAMSRVPALAALWAGLLYDPDVLDLAWQRVGTWTTQESRSLEVGVVQYGFNAPFREGTVQDLGLWMLALARQGLERRSLLDRHGRDESQYLTPLQMAAESGQTFAEMLLHRFDGPWQKDINTAMQALCKETFIE